MELLACFLVTVIVVMALACWGLHMELEERTTEIAQVRQQLERYLSDDQRMLDELWNRAQIETARALRSRKQS